jgi:hypothetical protein
MAKELSSQNPFHAIEGHYMGFLPTDTYLPEALQQEVTIGDGVVEERRLTGDGIYEKRYEFNQFEILGSQAVAQQIGNEYDPNKVVAFQHKSKILTLVGFLELDHPDQPSLMVVGNSAGPALLFTEHQVTGGVTDRIMAAIENGLYETE